MRMEVEDDSVRMEQFWDIGVDESQSMVAAARSGANHFGQVDSLHFGDILVLVRAEIGTSIHIVAVWKYVLSIAYVPGDMVSLEEVRTCHAESLSESFGRKH
jgi:hypothetical protein